MPGARLKQNGLLVPPAGTRDRNVSEMEAMQDSEVQAAVALDARARRGAGRSQPCLLNILPAPIVERLEAGEGVIADRHADVTVLFSDCVGFTRDLATWNRTAGHRAEPAVLGVRRACARPASRRSRRSAMRTWPSAGLPGTSPDHTERSPKWRCGMIDRVGARQPDRRPLKIRIGIHSGPVGGRRHRHQEVRLRRLGRYGKCRQPARGSVGAGPHPGVRRGRGRAAGCLPARARHDRPEGQGRDADPFPGGRSGAS